MHVIFRQNYGLEETAAPFDLEQDPADLVFLSFSDSDLGAFEAGWHRADGSLPSLRLANLVALKHPVSVDTYIEKTLEKASGILIRLIGGEQYWAYGLEQVHLLARKNNIALAVLSADGSEDPRLQEMSTLPVSTLRQLSKLCNQGGAVAAQAALAQMALASGFEASPVLGQKTVPEFGWYDPQSGPVDTLTINTKTETPLIFVVFYRSYLTAADTRPVDEMIHALRRKGFNASGLFTSSLKTQETADWVSHQLERYKPDAIINATAFSAKSGETGRSPLDSAGCPVYQVTHSTSRKKDWETSERGLSPSDLAMSVVLPEVDGRLYSGLVSFKQPSRKDPHLQFSRFFHSPESERINRIVDRVGARLELNRTSPENRKLAIILSTYPGKSHHMAHAIGLDTIASVEHLLSELKSRGYTTANSTHPDQKLEESLQATTISWPVKAYEDALERLPAELREQLFEAHGSIKDDPRCNDSVIEFSVVKHGNILIALQPERGAFRQKEDEYHDLTRPPCHSYVAFYLWLQQSGLNGLVHMGTHGTLEWLPGKSVALSEECWPDFLVGNLPVIYPFIVNDPGEAAQAKRRIGALTLGHLPPPLVASEIPEQLYDLERLLDEYSVADGLDPARRERLMDEILDHSQSSGVSNELGLINDMSAAEQITRIDKFVCEIKDSRFGDGLHIYGTGECGDAELAGLFRALDAKHVEAGPSGSPNRGKTDILPSGRNLFTTDPRAVPSRVAHAQGVKQAGEFIRKYLQDNGEYPDNMMIDIWGSATMRTAGEDFAMAMHLAGVQPEWNKNSDRVAGFNILSLEDLGRPRIGVTLRMSGLFRDVFPSLGVMFEQISEALSHLNEDLSDNPYIQKGPRVFGPAPGSYGVNVDESHSDLSEEARNIAGEAWLQGSEWSFAASGEATRSRDFLEKRVHEADGLIHAHDLTETDILQAGDFAAHQAGFAAAKKRMTGSKPDLYHIDTTNIDQPVARTASEEIARIVRARASNPKWVEGMKRHGFRGGSEIAATLEHMTSYAHLAEIIPSHLFDIYFDATLGRDDVVSFLKEENPQALAAMQDLFRRLNESGLWTTRRNSIIMRLQEDTSA